MVFFRLLLHASYMRRTRLAHTLYTGSLFLLILLTAVCIAISAADVIIQALADRTESGNLDFRNLIVVAASYVLLASYGRKSTITC